MAKKQDNDTGEIDALIERCQSEDSRTQIRAMMALEKAGAKQAVNAILPLLASTEVGVRNAAVDALGSLGDERVEDIGPALEAFLADPDGLVRSGATESLGMLGYKRARPAIERVLHHDEEWAVRASAAEALGELGDSDALGALTSALDDYFGPVRGFAALAIGLIGNHSALPVVRARLDMDDDPGTRGELLVAALRLGDDSGWDELMALVDGADDDLAIELYNTIEDMLSRKTPAVVIGRAAELVPRLAKLGGDKLQARLAKLVGNGGASE